MQSEEKKIVTLFEPWKIFAFEAFLFSLTLGLGIATASKTSKFLEQEKITSPQISLFGFIFYFFLATLVIFFLSQLFRFRKNKALVFKTLFTLAIFSGGITVFSAWLPDSISLILITPLLLWWFKKPTIFIQDLLIILGVAGAGSLIGLALSPSMVVLLLMLFSIYDFIAVYKTKHMIKMVKEMMESQAILALVVPPNISGFKESIKEVKPGGKFLILGGGDMVFPLLFSVSLVPFGLIRALVVAFFSLIGLFFGFFFFISQKRRQPIPALPPIALLSIIGYLITFFI